jgi:hypothetical protein
VRQWTLTLTPFYEDILTGLKDVDILSIGEFILMFFFSLPVPYHLTKLGGGFQMACYDLQQFILLNKNLTKIRGELVIAE